MATKNLLSVKNIILLKKTATKLFLVLKALFCCRKTATKCVIIKKFLCLRLKEVFWAPRKNKVFGHQNFTKCWKHNFPQERLSQNV